MKMYIHVKAATKRTPHGCWGGVAERYGERLHPELTRGGSIFGADALITAVQAVLAMAVHADAGEPITIHISESIGLPGAMAQQHESDIELWEQLNTLARQHTLKWRK